MFKFVFPTLSAVMFGGNLCFAAMNVDEAVAANGGRLLGAIMQSSEVLFGVLAPVLAAIVVGGAYLTYSVFVSDSATEKVRS